MRRMEHASSFARRTVLSGIGVFILLQTAFAIAIEHWLSVARDPEFAVKIQHLSEQMSNTPNQPLVVMLGSSRTSLGFRAGDIQGTPAGSKVLAFNFGVSGAGPLMQFVCLKRLLARDIVPDLLILEIHPVMFNQPGSRPLEEIWFQGGRMKHGELNRFERFHSNPAALARRWIKSRLKPWSGMHQIAERLLQPGWSEPAPGPGEGRIDSHGWEPHFLAGVSEEVCARQLEIAKDQYRNSLTSFGLATQAAAALSGILDLCRQRDIAVVLVLMPEGSAFRELYPAEVWTGLMDFFHKISEKWQVPLLNARNWLSDKHFWDAHHQLPTGATEFTQQLHKQVIIPYLRSRTPARSPSNQSELANHNISQP